MPSPLHRRTRGRQFQFKQWCVKRVPTTLDTKLRHCASLAGVPDCSAFLRQLVDDFGLEAAHQIHAKHEAKRAALLAAMKG